MTYTPTSIDGLDVESGEKIMKPGKVQSNLALISQETKLLDSNQRENTAAITDNRKEIDDTGVSFRKHLLFL